MNEDGIQVKVVRFINAANETAELDPADFRLTDRFQPPATGPSFDCRIARSEIETAICGNPILAKYDYELTALYRRMHLSYDTVGNRKQLLALQRAWLARRASECREGPDQVRCLAALYRRQHDVLENWLPSRELPKQ